MIAISSKVTEDPMVSTIKNSTVSPYGLPLKIDLPGISPDWIEESEEEDE